MVGSRESLHSLPAKRLTFCMTSGQTEARDTAGLDGASFLDRERAVLGEDASQFATKNTITTLENHDRDLLGGDDSEEDGHAVATGGDLDGFESSFPKVNTQNEVSIGLISQSDFQHPDSISLLERWT